MSYVRGLNNPTRQQEVKLLIQSCRPQIVCLQETKLNFVDRTTIANVLGTNFEDNFFYLPADGTKGGILLVARNHDCQLQNLHLTANAITAVVLDSRINNLWTITGVYGPQGNLEKLTFLRELKQIKTVAKPQWLFIGDFIMIYKSQDKNSRRLDTRLMLRFSKTLNHLEVKEADLIDIKFTWTNNQDPPTLTRIDMAFHTPMREDMYMHLVLHPLSSSISHHCPLLLLPLCHPPTKPKFRFEAFWTQMPGYVDCVQKVWSKAVPSNQNPLQVFHTKLSRTAKAL
jgi:exonuclease III